MESPYTYLQVDLQEHPNPIEFPPPFSIEEFNLYHHGYHPYTDYDKSAFYANQVAASVPPGTASMARNSHKPKGHNAKPSQHSSATPAATSHGHGPKHGHKNATTDIAAGGGKPQPPPIPPPASATPSNCDPATPQDGPQDNKLSLKALIRAKHTLQQRIKRQNETPEQKAARRQRNAELNRRRRQNKEDIRVTREKAKNRLRQRIKREIDRMLRTRQKRDDFLRETFEQMAAVFSDADMLQYQERVAGVVREISN